MGNILGSLSGTSLAFHDHDLVVVENVEELLHLLVHRETTAALQNLLVVGRERGETLERVELTILKNESCSERVRLSTYHDSLGLINSHFASDQSVKRVLDLASRWRSIVAATSIVLLGI